MRLTGTLGVVSDIHQEADALRIVLDSFATLGVSHILCPGDVADGAGDIVECISALAGAGAHVVAGNHDQWLLADTMRDLPLATQLAGLPGATRRFLEALPLTMRFETPLGGLLLCHGLGERTMAMVRKGDDGIAVATNALLQRLIMTEDVQLLVNGHTHERFVRRFDGLTIINAGTLHRSFDPCFATIRLDDAAVDFYALPPDGSIHREETILLDRGRLTDPRSP